LLPRFDSAFGLSTFALPWPHRTFAGLIARSQNRHVNFA
jgi:hypothetical protein